jgi:N-acetyl-gamma-glutamylphosphate reductase
VTPVAVIGASGYTGLELIKLLHNHPQFELTYLANSEGGIIFSPSAQDFDELCSSTDGQRG